MNETYVECLVKAKPSMGARLLKILLIVLTVFFGVGGLFVANLILVIVGIAFGVCAYIANMNVNIEYEYLYLDRELSVDKVMAQTRRKRIATYRLDRMEIFAPIKSYHLDNYKNANVTVKDYSIGEELQPDLRYAMFYEGGEKILLSPSEELVKVLKNVAPRKVFTD